MGELSDYKRLKNEGLVKKIDFDKIILNMFFM